MLKRLVALGIAIGSLGPLAVAEPGGSIHTDKTTTEEVSISELLAAPNKYDGKRIRVTGYLSYPSGRRKTQPVLCAKRAASGRLSNSGGCIELIVDAATLKSSPFSSTRRIRDLEKSYVFAEGVFESKARRLAGSNRMRISKIENNAIASERAKTSGYDREAYKKKWTPHAGDAYVGDFPISRRTSHLIAH